MKNQVHMLLFYVFNLLSPSYDKHSLQEIKKTIIENTEFIKLFIELDRISQDPQVMIFSNMQNC